MKSMRRKILDWFKRNTIVFVNHHFAYRTSRMQALNSTFFAREDVDAGSFGIETCACVSATTHACLVTGVSGTVWIWNGRTQGNQLPHELSFDDVIVLIQPWYSFFANGHRYVVFATFPKM